MTSATPTSGGICEGRVAIVTGAGRGIGREYALSLAQQGAAVVVNDVGTRPEGIGADAGPAAEVVAEIIAAGGRAVANDADVSDFAAAETMIEQAVAEFGRLDILVNNAGILRDRMLVNMSESEWDDVVRVHLKGTFAPTRHAAVYWRGLEKSGKPVDARVINTTSASGLYGHVAQTNYGAAKAGIAGFTVISAMELAAYGVTVNAIAPYALTRLSEPLRDALTDADRTADDATWIAPICTWLASPLARNVTGRVFEVRGDELAISESWHRGPTAKNQLDPAQLTDVVAVLMSLARPNADMQGNEVFGPGRPGKSI